MLAPAALALLLSAPIQLGPGGVVCPAGQAVTVVTGTKQPSICSAVGATTSPTMAVYARASAPSCGATWLSREIRVHDAGQADETWVCEFDVAGGYTWAAYSMAPEPGVAGTMASGIEFITVGGEFATANPVGQYNCTLTLTATSDGASSTQCWRQSGTGPSYGYYAAGAFYLAIGAKSRFNRVDLSLVGAWPITPQVNCTTPSIIYGVYTSRAESLDVPYAAAGMPISVTTHSGGALASGAQGTYGSQGYLNTNGRWDYGSNPFQTSGTWSWPLSAGQRAAWTRGWNATYGPAPSGITTGDYYWVSFQDGLTPSISTYAIWGSNVGSWCNTTAQQPVSGFSVQTTGVWDDG